MMWSIQICYALLFVVSLDLTNAASFGKMTSAALQLGNLKAMRETEKTAAHRASSSIVASKGETSEPKTKEKNSKTRKKILILMSDTGGGHRASAEALHRAIDDFFPKRFEVDIMDIWSDHANYPFNQFVPTYRYLAKHPVLWRGFYSYGNFPPTKLFTEIWSWKNSYKRMEKAIKASDPDAVISVHPLCQLIPISIIKDINRQNEKLNKLNPESKEKRPYIPFVTVVTDLGGAHMTWFDKRVDACYVPSKAVQSLALKKVAKDRVKLMGLPIRPSFWKPVPDKQIVRNQLRLQNLKTVLLMGGGDGVGGLDSIASAVAKKLDTLKERSQMVVVCGHNQGLIAALQATKSRYKNVDMVVKGFCNNIDEYMSASDCLVTKAGPGTIAEGMIRGLPQVLSYYLPGQEYGNIPYAVQGGFAIYTGMRPANIAKSVETLFTNSEMMKQMSANARALAHPEATLMIANDIGEMVLGEKSKRSILIKK